MTLFFSFVSLLVFKICAICHPTALPFITYLVEELQVDVIHMDFEGRTASELAGMKGGQYAEAVQTYLQEKEEVKEEEFISEGAPEEYKDVFSLRLMASSPVTASDGHVYEREGLESWIETCEEKGTR